MCDTYNYDYQKHSTFRFDFIEQVCNLRSQLNIVRLLPILTLSTSAVCSPGVSVLLWLIPVG